MLKFLMLAASLIASPQAIAADPPASDASIRQLLERMESRSMLAAMTAQMDQYMEQSMRQALQNRTPTVEQLKAMDRLRERLAIIMRESLTWESLEPIYVRLFRQHFTQSEVDGMLSFYATPAGQSLIKKMAAVMNDVMLQLQPLMPPIMQKIQAAIQESARELNSIPSEPKPAQ